MLVACFTIDKALFDPSGESIIAMFNDNTVTMWNLDNLAATWTVDLNNVATKVDRNFAGSCLVPISFSHDGTYLAIALNGSSAMVYTWDMSTKTLFHEIKIGEDENSVDIRKLTFVGNTNMVAILLQSGKIIFIDILTALKVPFKWVSGTFHVSLPQLFQADSILQSSEYNRMVSISSVESLCVTWKSSGMTRMTMPALVTM